MLGASAGPIGNSGDGATAGETHNSGGVCGDISEVGVGPSSIPCGGVLGDRDGSGSIGGGCGNRWPRQETWALLKIRSDMDGVFRDASLKGPLWEEVSRKMAELGFQRSAKKCKEKFENVSKYHKRTKDVRSSKPDGKIYRFFGQLEAFGNIPPNSATPPPPPAIPLLSNITVSSTNPADETTNNPIKSSPFVGTTSQPPSLPPPHTTPPPANTSLPSASSSSTSSDEGVRRRRRRSRKRKWKDYFERLMSDVVQKQQEMQNKFLDSLKKHELDRVAREEAWRSQESDRFNRERDLLAQERSMAAARDASVIAFLQKMTNQHNLQIPIITNIDKDNINSNNNAAQQAPLSENPPPLLPRPPSRTTQPAEVLKIDCNNNKGEEKLMQAGSSRWPKSEIEDLIKLRTSLDIKYQENGPKGPLWEEISAAMAKLGYSRSPKRCKEKWENINKYYKKVKERNRKRPEDSKTCPYFHLLEEIYRDKANQSGNPGFGLKSENPMTPIMARPEQQWPLSEHQQDSLMHDNESEQNDEDCGDADYDDEDEVGRRYEVIENKQQPPSSTTNTVESGGAVNRSERT